DAADLYDLTPERIVALERFADKSAQALVDAIQASKAQPLSRLLFALGVENVGETAAKQLAKQFGTMDELQKASVDDVLAIHGMGETIAQSVVDWFKNAQVRDLIDRLRARGLN